VKQINFAQDRDKLHVVLNNVTNFQFPKALRKFLATRGPIISPNCGFKQLVS